MRLLVALAAALAPALAAPAGGAAAAAVAAWVEGPSCAVAHRTLVDRLSTIALDAETLPRPLRSAVERAAAMWNDTACNADGSFPRFVLEGAADRHIAIGWHHGLSASDPTSCGSFAGREIRLYSRVRDPRTGVVRDCGDPARVAETVAHELGHVLGLLDQSAPGCETHIMSRLAVGRDGQLHPRWVQPAECRAADRKFVTAAERRRARRGLPLLVAEWELESAGP